MLWTADVNLCELSGQEPRLKSPGGDTQHSHPPVTNMFALPPLFSVLSLPQQSILSTGHFVPVSLRWVVPKWKASSRT